MKVLWIWLLAAAALLGQAKTARLRVTDPTGAGIQASLQRISEANQYNASFLTDRSGALDIAPLPFGAYQLTVRRAGFAPFAGPLEVESAVLVELSVKLSLASANTQLTVSAPQTLVNPRQAGAASHIGTEAIRNRLASLPGRSLQDLVNSQPGWLYEGNAVLHPRGSEYQTQLQRARAAALSSHAAVVDCRRDAVQQRIAV